MNWSTLSNAKIGSISIGTLCSALITLVICLVIIRILTKLITRILSRSKLEPRFQTYILKGLKLVAYIITVIMVIEGSGINTTSLVALLSVCSLGVTLAAEDILGNVAGGLVIIASHPFTLGDFIEADGVSGTVQHISLNHTQILTADGQVILMPNRALSSSKLTNYTTYGKRRIALSVSASYDAPTETVKSACRAALERTADWLPDPEPSVWITEYGDSAITYTIYCWTKTSDYLNTLLNLREAVRDTFAEANVEMTYNHLNVHMVQ